MEPVRFLERVTITGADNSIDPVSLYHLSNQFPFVEWGLLLHKTQDRVTPVASKVPPGHVTPGHAKGGRILGDSRFPSWPWLYEVAKLKQAFHEMRFAGHVCGEWVIDMAIGNDPFRAHDWPLFDRYQLNFHGIPHVWKKEDMWRLLNTLNREVIIQMDLKNEHIFTYLHAQDSDVTPLFDLSHGGGVLPDEWPEGGASIYGNTLCGYAGGLSPDNIQTQLPKIHQACGGWPVWIDCETHVRSHNGRDFDLDKVRAFLTACEPWVIEDD